MLTALVVGHIAAECTAPRKIDRSDIETLTGDEAWNEIVRIRNQGSHVQRLQRAEYERVLRATLAPSNLGPLLKIKDCILSGGS